MKTDNLYFIKLSKVTYRDTSNYPIISYKSIGYNYWLIAQRFNRYKYLTGIQNNIFKLLNGDIYSDDIGSVSSIGQWYVSDSYPFMTCMKDKNKKRYSKRTLFKLEKEFNESIDKENANGSNA